MRKFIYTTTLNELIKNYYLGWELVLIYSLILIMLNLFCSFTNTVFHLNGFFYLLSYIPVSDLVQRQHCHPFSAHISAVQIALTGPYKSPLILSRLLLLPFLEGGWLEVC